MEILNILYNNNHIAFYLIGAIIVVILIFIILSSMTSTPKEKQDIILKDPTETEEEQIAPKIAEEPLEQEIKNIPKINDLVEDLYQKSLDTEEKKEEIKDLNSFLEEFEVPENVIEEVVNDDIDSNKKRIELPDLKEEIIKEETHKVDNNQENIENMLKRLYDLRQKENDMKKNALVTEIYELKKQVDEALKSSEFNYSLNYNELDTKALADYYLFNEDIEFPKLK